MSRCTPRSVHGNGGVSLLWHKSLQSYVQKLNHISTDRVVGIRLVTADRPICFLPVYLPTRTGCTDDFKECMDYLDAVLGRLSFDNDVIIMGDLNADPGSEGGPLSSTSTNEQGRILLCYLQRWNYMSVHLHDKDLGLLQNVRHTYCSGAHNTVSTIDHILSPQHLLSRFSNSSVSEEEPTNFSDHPPVHTQFKCVLQSPSLSATTTGTTNKQVKVN